MAWKRPNRSSTPLSNGNRSGHMPRSLYPTLPWFGLCLPPAKLSVISLEISSGACILPREKMTVIEMLLMAHIEYRRNLALALRRQI